MAQEVEETKDGGPFRGGSNPEQVKVFMGSVLEGEINKWLAQMGSTIIITDRSLSSTAGQFGGVDTIIVIWYRLRG